MTKTVHQDQLTIVNILPSGNGFGLTSGGEQCYIPANVLSASNSKMGDELNAKLVDNDRDPAGRTPWMAIYLSDASPSEINRDIASDIISLLEENFYLTTKEIAVQAGLELMEANQHLNSMFAAGQIVKASVHSKPHQTRASFLLWAKDTSNFLWDLEK